MDVLVLCDKTSKPIANAVVCAFTTFSSRRGVEAKTDAQGIANLSLPTGIKEIEVLCVYPNKEHWSFYERSVPTEKNHTVRLQQLSLKKPDCLRHFIRCVDDTRGKDVRIGIIDSGVDTTHDHLTVSNGLNTVLGESDTAYGDNGIGHGTHVAGIIASNGKAPSGMQGIAPKVELYSYRICPQGSEEGSIYDLVVAIDAAVSDECDIINISMATPLDDPLVASAIDNGVNHGTLTVAAAGNESVNTVFFPARHTKVLGIASMGRIGTFPITATENLLYVSKIVGTDKNNFFARSSNYGSGIDVIAPGVAIISTVPGGYLAMSGTSMASPVITGIAASILGSNSSLLSMDRTHLRVDGLCELLFGLCKTLGFSAEREGHGIPQVI